MRGGEREADNRSGKPKPASDQPLGHASLSFWRAKASWGRIAGYYSAPGMAMGKRPKKRDYSDKTRIDMNHFNVSDQELEDAVRVVGTSVKKIETTSKIRTLEQVLRTRRCTYPSD